MQQQHYKITPESAEGFDLNLNTVDRNHSLLDAILVWNEKANTAPGEDRTVSITIQDPYVQTWDACLSIVGGSVFVLSHGLRCMPIVIELSDATAYKKFVAENKPKELPMNYTPHVYQAAGEKAREYAFVIYGDLLDGSEEMSEKGRKMVWAYLKRAKINMAENLGRRHNVFFPYYFFYGVYEIVTDGCDAYSLKLVDGVFQRANIHILPPILSQAFQDVKIARELIRAGQRVHHQDGLFLDTFEILERMLLKTDYDVMRKECVYAVEKTVENWQPKEESNQ